jgi:hypothetical protein
MADEDNKEKGKYAVAQMVMVGVFIAVAFIIAILVQGDPKTKLTMSIGYGLLVLMFAYGMTILVAIINGEIDLSTLLSEDGKASMSRFQLMIFTFVIALSLFLMVTETGSSGDPKFPEVPASVLTLLGISASTYAVSKGIQAGSKNGDGKDDGKGDGKGNG